MTQAYDEIGLLKPVKVDLFTGYRMYSAEQIPVLQKIVLLRDTKFTTLEIKDIIQRCN
ncbi:MerR family transcriptional regulator [Clostridium simiarum]|uniref:MerR family transcriptional regulator n=1 Tax=Clostridium simiarum TaxID=2841506 RepID=UPI001FEC9936|nr:MerR family transcriptional regulator [Clostridium simiarum]